MREDRLLDLNENMMENPQNLFINMAYYCRLELRIKDVENWGIMVLLMHINLTTVGRKMTYCEWEDHFLHICVAQNR